LLNIYFDIELNNLILDDMIQVDVIVDNEMLDKLNIVNDRFDIFNNNNIIDLFLTNNINDLFGGNINNKYYFLLGIFVTYFGYSILDLDVLIINIINIFTITHS